MSWGSKETDNLRTNIENQLNRLLAQLQDLDDLKDVCEIYSCSLSFSLSSRSFMPFVLLRVFNIQHLLFCETGTGR